VSNGQGEGSSQQAVTAHADYQPVVTRTRARISKRSSPANPLYENASSIKKHKDNRNILAEIVNGTSDQNADAARPTQRSSRKRSTSSRKRRTRAQRPARSKALPPMPMSWVQLEPWGEVITTHPTSRTTEMVESLTISHLRGEEETFLMEHILMQTDIWTCQKARSVSRSWCKVVGTLCDGQFLPFQRVFNNPANPYIHRVVGRMTKHECDFMVDPDSPDDIGKINRELFVNFLVDIQEKLMLNAMTLAYAMSYINRYMACTVMPTNRLLLLGVTSLFIASKVEEVDRIPLMMFIEVTDHTCSVQEVQDMELTLIKCLDFRLAPPTPISFLSYLG